MSTVNPEIQQIQQAIDEQKIAADIKDNGIQELKLESGQVFKGSPEQIKEQLQKSVVEGSRTIQQTKTEMEQLRQEIANLKASQSAKPEVQQQDNTEYFKKWAEKPGAATVEALAHELGIDPQEYVKIMRTNLESGSINNASSQFMARRPDFPNDANSAKALQKYVPPVLQRFGVKSMAGVTADHLELAYQDAIRDGAITPAGTISGTITQTNPLPTLRGISAPPSPETDAIANFGKLSEEQMAATLAMLRRQAEGR